LDHRFDAAEWNAMDASQRVARCTTVAKEASKLANMASPELARHFMTIAEQWLELAVEILRDGQRNSV